MRGDAVPGGTLQNDSILAAAGQAALEAGIKIP
jgi:hypothetical protein